jgi:REP element-mobilizing transposase RayT
MGRRRRPDLPGAVFHLTARTLDRQRLFTAPLRTRALELIVEAVPRSGARLLAVAIMASHLHLVVQQGRRPVATLMQPLLRRLAHLLQRARDVEGPVFWRPYGCTPCMDPRHARNAIAYTHLNPVRAGVCSHPGAYPWTSHRIYAVGVAGTRGELAAQILSPVLDPGFALPLFAADAGRTTDELRIDYCQYIAWRLVVDRGEAEGSANDGAHDVRPPPVSPTAVDAYWGRAFSPLFHTVHVSGPSPRHPPSRPAPDIADVARATLAAEAPELPLNLVRGRRGGVHYARIRHRMIRNMHAAGYRNVDIARFIGLSESAVSRVLCASFPC